MKDEEKAEESYNKIRLIEDISPRFNYIKGYLDGLVEGRKEVYEEFNWITDTDNYIASKLERLKELERENAELKEHRDRLINLNIKLAEKKEKQKAQIEKMKNVGNCKKAMTCAKWNEKQTILGFMKFCKDCKEWELSE